MPKGYYKDLIKLLKKQGYEYEANAKGSHEWWVHVESGKKILVSKNCYSRHTANGILKDAGLQKKF